jgi:glutathione synthase
VFLVERDASNLNQMVDAIARTGYVMAQEYLPARTGVTPVLHGERRAAAGGRPVAALKRIAQGEDFRANMTAGARPKKARVTDACWSWRASSGRS